MIIQPPTRKRWTCKETESILKEFKKYIERKLTPPLSICENYVELYQRDKKQIQDKVKNIIKYS